MDLASAQDFQRLYGEFVAVWKTWNASTRGQLPITTPEYVGWGCLERATAAEGEIEALMAKLAAERVLTEKEIKILGGVRQAFKSVRLAIQQGEPLDWRSSGVEPYVAFKSLSAAMSVLLRTAPRAGSQLTDELAAENFLKITDNRHEGLWIQTAEPLVPNRSLTGET
ncbi:hypothetical protein [Streptomyces sp. NPDC000405]|uniref:hypothetical protein n=1 Tax=Streptomyces sp. NPDC000405 TaxID=3161033 RepID=UPI00398D44C3